MKPCTPYQGRFTVEQQGELIELLWDCLKPAVGPEKYAKHFKQTGYGTKTQSGLLSCIERIVTPVQHWTREVTTEEILSRR